jgi:hypothetical protein
VQHGGRIRNAQTERLFHGRDHPAPSRHVPTLTNVIISRVPVLLPRRCSSSLHIYRATEYPVPRRSTAVPPCATGNTFYLF